jgi:putative ATPase
MDFVKNEQPYPIPSYLKDSHYGGAEKLGNGIGYKYPHDYENHYVEQVYLPEEIKNIRFFDEE